MAPLHLATESSHGRRVKALLEYGADPFAIDDYGWNPLHFAVTSASQETVDLLLPYRIDPYKTALVRIIGTHEDKMDVFDLVRIVNRYLRQNDIHLDRDRIKNTSTSR